MIIKEFNQFITKSEIVKYLEENFSEEWFNFQLSERCYDYLDEDDTEPYDGDYEETYQNLCMGGAIEYDLLGEIEKDVMNKFDIKDRELLIEDKTLDDIINDYFIDNCHWHDRMIFHKSDIPYNKRKGYNNLLGDNDLTINW